MLLLVKTKLGRSEIHGVGLFADQFIAAGTPTWVFAEGFDVKLTPDAIAQLPEHARHQCNGYCFRCTESGDYILCSDDARFFNHADLPNTHTIRQPDGRYLDVATRDIHPGEELTCDYRSFDAEWSLKLSPPQSMVA